jgi:hydroxypyruvate reductase
MQGANMKQHRDHLLQIFNAALQSVNGRECVSGYLSNHPMSQSIYLVAIGKAAMSMTEGALEVLGERLIKALVITKYGHGKGGDDPRVACMESGHPYPDSNSLCAGDHLLEFIQHCPADAQLLFLISGGSSSLVEKLPEGVDLAALERMNRWLLGAGYDIAQINHIRKRVSCIKGGRLAAQLNGRKALCLLLSDVVDDDPAVIGSGLLVPDKPKDIELDILELPHWLIDMLQCAPPLPQGQEPCFDSIETHLLANNLKARQAATNKARELGYKVMMEEALVTGDAVEEGKRLAALLLNGSEGVYIWGGETTVVLPPSPGRGGRCQSLALAAAQVLARHQGVYLLAAGTDGSDGPCEDAGALIDGNTQQRGELHGLSLQQCLDGADAGRFLETSGDLLNTGPTGTNVMDLMLGLKLGP